MSDRQSTIRTEAAETEGSGPAPASWDPYEVWRTRVLLPRLEDQRRSPQEPAAEKSTESTTRLDPANAVS